MKGVDPSTVYLYSILAQKTETANCPYLIAREEPGVDDLAEAPNAEVRGLRWQAARGFWDATIDEAAARGNAGELIFFARENWRTVGTKSTENFIFWLVDSKVLDRHIARGAIVRAARRDRVAASEARVPRG